MSGVYYNDDDPFVAVWLRNLAAAGEIDAGVVDSRSIADLVPEDVRGFTTAHFFAGIGGWPLALRLAGWSVSDPVWTGSCPCQPFPDAGRRRGTKDARHLWPEWFRLIEECRPPVVLGEQVASKAGLAWLDAVSADLEGAGYAVGAADLCAAGVGAPHIRQRIYFAAVRRLGHRGGARARRDAGTDDRAQREGARVGQEPRRQRDGTLAPGAPSRVGEPDGERREGVPEAPGDGEVRGFWDPADWVLCRDPGGPRWRPVEPGTFPLAHGVPARVGRLRAYGNAIVPEVAAEFVSAVMESL